MPYPHQDVMLHVREQDRNALLRRKSKTEAERKTPVDELPAEPDDDKLLP